MISSVHVLTRSFTDSNETVDRIYGVVEGRRAACERALSDLNDLYIMESEYYSEMFSDDLLIARIVLDKYLENKSNSEVTIGFRAMDEKRVAMFQIMMKEVPVLTLEIKKT